MNKVTVFQLEEGVRPFEGKQYPNLGIALSFGERIKCRNCKKNWNEHNAAPIGKAPAGMCLTKENLAKTNTYIVE